MILQMGFLRWLGATCGLGVVAGAVFIGCDTSPLLAPTSSTITLSANESNLPVNGSTDVTAIVIESAGTAVQNGTIVTFTTTLGSIDPREARTQNGQAIVRFNAGTRSGQATIRASSGNASPPEDADALTIRVGAAAVGRVSLTANPATLPSQGGTSEITARVFDVSGNPLAGVAVSFSIDAESAGSAEISNPVVTTNENGEARTRVTTTNDVTIVATVGGTSGDEANAVSATFTLRVNPIPVLTISATPTSVSPGAAVTFTLAAAQGQTIRNVRVRFGDGDSVNIGAVGSSPVTVSHAYEDEGTFTVTATGTDNRGETASTSTAVVVTESQVEVTIATAGTLGVGETITFTVTVLSATAIVTSVNWDFGDGNTARTDGRSTSHVYGAPGARTVTARVSTTTQGSGTGLIQIFISP